MVKFLTYITSFILVLTLSACQNNTVFDAYIPVPGKVWDYKQSASFEFDIKDTTVFYDMYLNVRNTGDYPYQNLYVFITLEGPQNMMVRDTLNCQLANNRGKWLGKGIGESFDSQIPFQQKIRFLKTGKYKVFIEQAMRDTLLQGISDIGFAVKKHIDN